MENTKENVEESDNDSFERDNDQDDSNESKSSKNDDEYKRENSKTKDQQDSDDSNENSISLDKVKKAKNGRRFSNDSNQTDEQIGSNDIVLNFSHDKFHESLQDFKMALIREQPEKSKPIVSNWFESNNWNTE